MSQSNFEKLRLIAAAKTALDKGNWQQLKLILERLMDLEKGNDG